MFTHNVIAWGSRAGYDSEEEAVEAAKRIVRAYGTRIDVENDRTQRIVRSYVLGPSGVPQEIPADSCGVVVRDYQPCVGPLGCKGPHNSPKSYQDWLEWHRAGGRKVDALAEPASPAELPPCLGTPRCHGNNSPLEHVPACPSFVRERRP